MRLSARASGLLEVAADPLEVRRLAAFLREICAAASVDEMAVMDCELALVEAANNVVEHGYAGLEPGPIILEVQIGDGQVCLILSDRGHPVPADRFDHCGMVSPDAEEGRGCSIIQACVDEIAYSSEKGSNRLTLVKHL